MQRLSALLAILCVLPLSACDGRFASRTIVVGGNPQRGAAAIRNVGCGICHAIPGIEGANGKVGPPLDNIGQRMFIAGIMPNTPDNMVVWLMTPQSIVPGNAMPNLGLNAHEARDIAAYLYTLR
ncbi:cytochrome c family protein [Methylovirgula sp. HY1]|uniref:c-type cytochrome n=1 Tax=Methylovirgula sp. HY1 TaxID=2822761 RepID=UPI001C5BD86E|nr:c-type cytochrome [Methylovirgula sp. HY1]QXX74103.1 Cytochrome c oxidase subunit 2 [Methylovirgula sp. HY1]